MDLKKAKHKVAFVTANDNGFGKSDLERLRVIQMLDAKRIALFEAEGDLRTRMRGASSTDRSLLLNAISQIILELDRVEGRLDAIEAMKAFKVPSQKKEQELLDAIRDVGTIADANAAIGELAEAVLRLVNSYKAKSTEK